MTTITPFGMKGPWANQHGDELVTYAMAGIAYSTPGMPDAANDLVREPPLHPASFVAETVAGLCAGLASLTAVLGRAKTSIGMPCRCQPAGRGSVNAASRCHHTFLSGRNVQSPAQSHNDRPHAKLLSALQGRLRDNSGPNGRALGATVEAMGNPEWASTPKFATSPARTENWIELRMRLIDWTMTLLGEDLYGLANQTQLPIFQFYSVRQLVGSDQVRARNSVVDVEIGNRRAKMPGAPFTMQTTPWTLRRPAPRLGEHNAAVLGEAAEALS